MSASRWVSLGVLCAGFLLIVVDMTVVNVALPSIRRDLGFSQAGLAWVVNGYLVAYGGVLLLAGRLGDLVGRKRIFVAGLVLFTAASVLCGLSFTQPMLIAARFIQGVGGGVSSAVILGMVVTLFTDPAERARAMGIFAFVASGGSAVGLLVGGVITQTVSWHWIFFVNLPIGVAAVVFAVRRLETDRGIGLGKGADVLGAALVTASMMLGVYTIVDYSSLGLSLTLVLGAVAVFLLVAFLVRQATAGEPLVPLRIFRSRNLSGANVVQAMMVAAFFGMFFMGTLYMERVLHYGPLQIGLAFLPDTLAMGALSYSFTARLISRFGPRPVMLAGLALIAVGLGLFALTPVHSDYLRNLFAPMVLLGVGAGLCFPALTIVAMADATPEESGLASGLLNTTTQIGGSLGLAVLATLSIARTSQLSAQGVDPDSALSSGYHLAWAIGAGLVVVALGLAFVVLRSEVPAADSESSPVEERAIA